MESQKLKDNCHKNIERIGKLKQRASNAQERVQKAIDFLKFVLKKIKQLASIKKNLHRLANGCKILRKCLISIKFLPGAGPPAKVLDKGLQLLVATLKKADKTLKPINDRAKKFKKPCKNILKNLQKIKKILKKSVSIMEGIQKGLEKAGECSEQIQEQINKYEDKMAQLNFQLQQFDEYQSSVSHFFGLFDGLVSEAEKAYGPFEGAFKQFDNLYDGMKEIKALSIITDYMEWGLGQVDKVIDEILKATGIDKMLNNLMNAINPLVGLMNELEIHTQFFTKFADDYIVGEQKLEEMVSDLRNVPGSDGNVQGDSENDIDYGEDYEIDEFSFGDEGLGKRLWNMPAIQWVKKALNGEGGGWIQVPTTVAEMRRMVKKQLKVIMAHEDCDGFQLQAYSEAQDWFKVSWWNYQRCGVRYGGQWHYIYDAQGEKWGWNKYDDNLSDYTKTV